MTDRSIPRWALQGRSGWRYHGQERPDFAHEPAPGQASVWDYPRPPRVEVDRREVTVRSGATLVARTHRSVRVLETASPPTVYLPFEDVTMELLTPASGSSRCEWKGEARYWTLTLPEGRLAQVAWSYPDPFPGFEALRDHISFYPGRVECWIDSVRVEPQPGRFYGGWVTPDLAGPFKGEPGSEGW